MGVYERDNLWKIFHFFSSNLQIITFCAFFFLVFDSGKLFDNFLLRIAINRQI